MGFTVTFSYMYIICLDHIPPFPSHPPPADPFHFPVSPSDFFYLLLGDLHGLLVATWERDCLQA